MATLTKAEREKQEKARAALHKMLAEAENASDPTQAYAAHAKFAKAVQGTIREALLDGDNLNGIYTVSNYTKHGSTPEYPVDLLAPGEEDQYVAYTGVPGGKIPQRHIEGDYVQVPTFQIQSSIDFLLKYASDPNLDTVGRALAILMAGFQKKINMDGWHTLLMAGVDRNIVAYDAEAQVGQFTKRLISLMKTLMRRNGGGNTTSIKQRRLTDLFMSIEGLEDIRNWGLDQVSDITRSQIFMAADGDKQLTRIFGVDIHEMVEFGEGQPYQNFFVNQLNGAMGDDVELVFGIDMNNKRDFVNPVVKDIEIFADPTFHRNQRASYYGWYESGYGILDNRSVILGMF